MTPKTPDKKSRISSSSLLQILGGGNVIGSLLIALAKPVQIAPMRSSTSDLVNLAALAAHEAAR